jgi:hypothetical protein
MRPTGWDLPHLKPLRVWLNPEHGPALMALPFELVWATTWKAEANEWIAPHLGLPELPHVEWAETHAFRSDGTYFKTHDIVTYAAGRPFAWIDDEIGNRDREYVEANHGARALLHYINPAVGLVAADFETLAKWAASLAEEASA